MPSLPAPALVAAPSFATHLRVVSAADTAPDAAPPAGGLAARPRALDGIVAVLCGDLRDAVEKGDEVRARFDLACLVQSLGGKTDHEMETRKACRAFDFRVSGERVTYRIERHPGRSWLTHRTTMRAVDLNDGTECTLHDEPERIFEDQLYGFAKLPTTERTRPKERDYARAASDAVEYAVLLARAAQDVASDEDIALGWAARLARSHSVPRGFAGQVGHVLHGLRLHYGSEVAALMLEDWHERAARVVELASAIWAPLHERVNEPTGRGPIEDRPPTDVTVGATVIRFPFAGGAR